MNISEALIQILRLEGVAHPVGRERGAADPIRSPSGASADDESFHSTRIIEAVCGFGACVARLFEFATPVFEAIGATISRFAELPESPGYEPLLIQLDRPPLVARVWPHFVYRFGQRYADEVNFERPRMKLLNSARISP
jgi:hypothetical protein